MPWQCSALKYCSLNLGWKLAENLQSSQNFTKLPKKSPQQILLEEWCISKYPRKLPNIWATLVRKNSSRDNKKSLNLVTWSRLKWTIKLTGESLRTGTKIVSGWCRVSPLGISIRWVVFSTRNKRRNKRNKSTIHLNSPCNYLFSRRRRRLEFAQVVSCCVHKIESSWSRTTKFVSQLAWYEPSSLFYLRDPWLSWVRRFSLEVLMLQRQRIDELQFKLSRLWHWTKNQWEVSKTETGLQAVKGNVMVGWDWKLIFQLLANLIK